MRRRLTVLVAAGAVAAVALTGCGGSSSSSSSSSVAPSTAAAAPSTNASQAAPDAGGGDISGTCTEIKKLVGNEKVQALIAGETDGSLSSILAVGEQLAPLLGDFLSDLPKDAPAPVTKELLNVAGLLAGGVTTGSLSDDQLEQLEVSTNSVLTWAQENCGVDVGGGNAE